MVKLEDMNDEKIPQGLSEGEVATLVMEGKVNAYDMKAGKSVWRIIADNTLNLFWVLNALIAVALIAVGSYTNAVFMVFVMVGTVSGIVVELKARSMVNKLTLINKGMLTVVRDGEEVTVEPEEVVLGDVMKLVSGDQVPADATVLVGDVEVNEALLTGEPDLVAKKKDGKLLSGSFVTSGQCYAKVIHVGADNYVTKLAIEAKTHKPIKSEILGSIGTVARFTSRVILPLGAILLLEALLMRHDTLKDSVVSTSAALLGMLPKGLAVLTIIALITAVFKLGRKKVLVQEIYSVETMAHVDMLCLDKTGTLTDGRLKVRGVETLSKQHKKREVLEILGSYTRSSIDNNSTMEAMKGYFEENEKYEVGKIVSFSSDRKWGAMWLEGVGTVVLGAPEKIFKEVPEGVEAKQKRGMRVLGVGVMGKKIGSAMKLTGVEPIAIIELEDGIRKDAKRTLTYLRKQGIELRVISGDNPMTVSKVAQRAGFTDYENYVDVSGMSDDEVREVAMTAAIFGRVSPYQKRLIVREMRAAGKTVAMTGDGVNDILAMREADLSIVMAEGDTATKQVGNIVLLESDFSELPDVLFEGRRVVNNMARVSSIFFIKTMYAFFVSVLLALSGLTGTAVAFPFVAIQITVIDQVLEGFPTLFMSFEPDNSRVPKKFLRDSLLRALPQSIMITVSLVVIYIIAMTGGWRHGEMVTLMYHAVGTVTLIGLFKACVPFSKLRMFLFSAAMIGFYLSAFILGQWFGDLVHLEVISGRASAILMAIAAVCVGVATVVWWVGKKRRVAVEG